MFQKYILLFFILKMACVDVYCDKSLTIVLDASGSMDAEMTIIKNNIPKAIQNIKNSNIVNYILVPFYNPNVGSRIVSSTTAGLIDAINTLEYRRGNKECTEISLQAIEKALDASKFNSYIFVFTDAEAKDYYKFNTIHRLCTRTQSQVFIFRSGKCLERLPEISEKVYYDVAKSCNGSVFNLNIKDLYQAFTFLKEISNVDWTQVNTPDEFTGAKQFTLQMDVYTKNVIAAVSCLSPYMDITDDMGGRPNVRTVMAAPHAIVRNVMPEIGNYNIDIRCDGPATATFYRRLSINFQYGFSPVRPRSIYETSARPLPGNSTYMYIALPENTNARIMSVKLEWDSQESKELEYESSDEERSCYTQHTFVFDYKYKIVVKCIDIISNTIVIGTSDHIIPQTPDPQEDYNKLLTPRNEITTPETILIDFNTTYTLSCKVFAYPQPTIWWEDEMGETISSLDYLIEIPRVYISYITIDNVVTNSSVHCKSNNSVGQSSLTIEYYVNRTFTFDVIQIPSDTTIAYGDEGKLYCEVNAYPAAEIKWYHNDSLIDFSENKQVVPEEHLLLINRMSLDDSGEYKCQVSNQVELKTYTAIVNIIGLEPPQIQLDDTEIILQPGDSSAISCSVISGTPIPEVSWKYKRYFGKLYEELPVGVEVNGKFIKIESAGTSHNGVYVCEASNIIGQESKDVTLKVQYAPKIENDVDKKDVRKSQEVELPCRVDAVPAATVRWEMYHDDVIMNFDDHHSTDENNTHRFVAQANDSGMYHCIVENSMGRAVRKVSVNVLVKPIIEPYKLKIPVRSGRNVVIPCNLIEGNPVPTFRMEFSDRNENKQILARDKGKLVYNINNVGMQHVGVYQCIAENSAGSDWIKVPLDVI